MSKSVFMLGKGGSGKTTLATLFAIYAARSGQNVLLVSLDPAHNLSDILEKRVKSIPTKIIRGFEAMEVDLNFWVQKYLHQTSQAVRRNYQYLTSLNLDTYFDLYRYAPGLDEYGLLMVYRQLVSEHKDIDYLIFDMPPTALSLQFFRLPGQSIKWLEKLLELRAQILEKQKIITRVKLGKITIEQDKPLVLIQKRLKEFRELIGNFENTKLNAYELICNPDVLSFNEAADIAKEFENWNFRITHLIVNKSGPRYISIERPSQLQNLCAFEIRAAGQSLTGLQNLEKFLAENKSVFGDLWSDLHI